MDRLGFRDSYRRNLPHIQPPGATLFVTFRLAGSLPVAVVQALLDEAERVERRLAQLEDEAERVRVVYRERRRQFGRWDSALDSISTGPRWLSDPALARLVADSLHYRDGKVYELDCFCIMHNHVHVVFRPLEKADGTFYALPAIMHSLKRYTASEANKWLQRQGPFWQHESYDHVVRGSEELGRIRAYVVHNPVKAGLVARWEDWPWTYLKESYSV